MDHRPLLPDEDVMPGDWHVYRPAGPDDRMTFTAPNWFIHPALGRCFRFDAQQAKLQNDWIFCGYTSNAGIYRDEFEDF